jgi:uncharacterized protein
MVPVRNLAQAAPRPNIGIFADEDAALSGVVARLVEALDPQAIWLFGSRARGDHRPDSDFDLLVVAKENGSFRSNDYVKTLRPTFDTGVDCEVIPCSLDDFEEAKTLRTTLVAQVVENGKLVYEARA